ncbi:hypothetical protein EV361DRAFT_914867 [Lentinula raphanica]|nr:hypothetical protein EV361DRAFT_914867 [Lentinula raphanica]
MTTAVKEMVTTAIKQMAGTVALVKKIFTMTAMAVVAMIEVYGHSYPVCACACTLSISPPVLATILSVLTINH